MNGVGGAGGGSRELEIQKLGAGALCGLECRGGMQGWGAGGPEWGWGWNGWKCA